MHSPKPGDAAFCCSVDEPGDHKTCCSVQPVHIVGFVLCGDNRGRDLTRKVTPRMLACTLTTCFNTYNLPTLIGALLVASQRSRDGVRLNRSKEK